MLENVLAQKKAAILDNWRQRLAQTYPADAATFLRNEKDRFANPVGHAIDQATEALIEYLQHDSEMEQARPALDKLLRIRAVQDFTPSQAVAPLYVLKTVVREQLGEALDGVVDSDRVAGMLEMERFAQKVDQLALMAFDIYTACREQLAEVRIHEAKRASEGLIERLNASRRRETDK